MTLAQLGGQGRDNAFGMMRLLLAGVVIVSHAFPLGGWGPDPTGDFLPGEVSIGFLALLAFFVMSGYLVTTSARRTTTLSYLWHRCLRIFPAFWVVLVFGAVIVGPLAWLRAGHGLAGYWTLTEGGPVSYVLRNLSIFIFQYGIHDLFLDSPYGDLAHQPVINGSIWSIYFEVRLYLTIAILAALKVLVRARWLVPLGACVAIASVFLVDWVPELVPVVHGLFGPIWGARLAGVFLLGATAALYPEYVKLDGRLAAIAAVVAVQTLAIDGFVLIGDVCFAYVILWLCFRAPVWARRLPGRHDISYGVYLYAFPIQLLLTAYGIPKLGFLPYVAITVALTVPLALMSWLMVERPALRLRNRGPGRIDRRRPLPVPDPQPTAVVT